MVRTMIGLARVGGLCAVGVASVVVGVGLVWRFVTPSASSAMLTGELVVMLGLVVLPAPAVAAVMIAGIGRLRGAGERAGRAELAGQGVAGASGVAQGAGSLARAGTGDADEAATSTGGLRLCRDAA